MSRIVIYITGLLLALSTICNAQSTVNIYRDIDKYISGINPHPDSLISASNRLISMSDNKILKTAIAGYLFNKFSASQVMGHESVAVYIAKRYFLEGDLVWQGEGGREILKMYVEFNENSLIGLEAPELNLSAKNGELLNLKSIRSNYIIIYFYDTNCNICNSQLPELKEITESKKYLGVSVYAVYTGRDTSAMAAFVNSNFNENKGNWNFVYDPTGESGFHKLYNVLSTPRLFLLDRNKKIIGRNLTNKTLNELIEKDEARINNLYNEAENFIPAYLSLFDLKDTSQYLQAFDPLFKKLISDHNDTYNAVFYHLFEYLFNDDNQSSKEAAIFVAEKYIYPYSFMWRDTLYPTIVVPAKVQVIKNNRTGSVITNIPLYFLNGKTKLLHKLLAKKTLIYFFSTNCEVCKVFTQELKENYKYFKKRGLKIIAIYTGNNREDLENYIKEIAPPWKILSPKDYNYLDLYDRFEVSQVPQTYMVNKNGMIISKRIFTSQIKEILR